MLIKKSRVPIKEVILIGLLPGFLKVFLYKLKGHSIGKGVKIGFGSVICGNHFTIGDYTKIGFFTIIRGKEVRIGRHVSLGTMTFLDTPFINIGDGTKINEQVYVGGLQNPDSEFVVGRNCQIMQMTFINPSVSIKIGDDSGIGGNCALFGHSSWLSCFEGYLVEFKPITIGNSVSVSWGAFVLPGADIGDGAVIGPYSMVNRQIPPRCLAIGYPARVVSKYPDFPSEVSGEEKVKLLKTIVEEMIRMFQSSGIVCQTTPGGYSITHFVKRWWCRRERTYILLVRYDPLPEKYDVDNLGAVDVFLSLRGIAQSVRARVKEQRTLWIDIESKERADIDNDLGDEVVLFLRRYGVRFSRV
jgi:acetyltransferase-like isoleucine patch superfamily enzyme